MALLMIKDFSKSGFCLFFFILLYFQYSILIFKSDFLQIAHLNFGEKCALTVRI